MRFIDLNQKTYVGVNGSYSIRFNKQFYIIVYRARVIGKKILTREIDDLLFIHLQSTIRELNHLAELKYKYSGDREIVVCLPE
jgi:hypothetical protein